MARRVCEFFESSEQDFTGIDLSKLYSGCSLGTYKY